MHNIDRKTASRLLKVSVRTVDRYIVAGKLSIEKYDGRIWLNRSEINKLRARQTVDTGVDMSTPAMSIDKQVSTPVDIPIDSVHFVSTSESEKRSENKAKGDDAIYKKLFEDTRSELRLKQERLEGANYRVGQLEGLLKESVPLLDHQRALLAERNEKDEIQKTFNLLQLTHEQLRLKFKDERLNKRVFLIVLFIIMLLQPLWLFLSLRQ